MPVFVVRWIVPYPIPDNLSQYRIPDYEGIRFRVYGLSTGWDALVAMTPLAQYRASLFPMIVFLSSAGGRNYPDKENKNEPVIRARPSAFFSGKE